MRVIGSVEVGGVWYQAVWGSLSSTDNQKAGSGKALAVRGHEGRNETVIRRNARLAEVQASLRQPGEVQGDVAGMILSLLW